MPHPKFRLSEADRLTALHFLK